MREDAEEGGKTGKQHDRPTCTTKTIYEWLIDPQERVNRPPGREGDRAAFEYGAAAEVSMETRERSSNIKPMYHLPLWGNKTNDRFLAEFLIQFSLLFNH